MAVLLVTRWIIARYSILRKIDGHIHRIQYDTILSILFASICIILIDGGKVVPSNHPISLQGRRRFKQPWDDW